MNLPALYEIASEYRQQLSQLVELDIDEQTLADTLEGIQWPVEEKARAVAAVIGNMDATAEMVNKFAKRKAGEAKRMQARADRLRQYLLDNMLACGISEIKSLDGSLTIKTKLNPPSVVIDSSSSLPVELFVYPEAPPPYPDKKAIAARLKAGEAVEGAHLEQRMRLEIK